MPPPPRAISFLLEIELSSKDQKDSLGRDESNDTQFYLLRSVIDLPGQVKLKNVAVLVTVGYQVCCLSNTDDDAVFWCQAS